MSGVAPPIDLTAADAGQAAPPPVWLDLDNPTDAEREQAERLTGLRVPDGEEIAEIETSSRLVNDHGVLRLSTPMLSRGADGVLTAAPVGFVVTPERLLTVRYAGSIVFDHFSQHWRSKDTDGAGPGMEPFLGLLEAIVDRLADVLEHMAAELDALSTALFAPVAQTARSARGRDLFLQETLSQIGVKGERISQLRDGLLGVGRIVRFVPDSVPCCIDEAQRRRLATLDRDVVSLSDYDAQLTSKVQFLLDATLGFINIQQNDAIKVLTVVSIVGIPPTFVASLYGMNFHNMPELSWKYGYQFGLSMIALSIAVPLLLFWRRGWL